jgi:hypothetical protein
MIATIVNWTAVGKVVLYSMVVTVGVSIAFGIAVRGTTRFAEVRRAGRAAAATAYAAVAATAFAASLAAVGYGIFLMTQK